MLRHTLRCFCGGATRVSDARPAVFDKEPSVRRRRVCLECGERFFTVEIREVRMTLPEADDIRRTLKRAQRALEKAIKILPLDE